MALAQFKRILPPPPPRDIQEKVAEMILAEAMRVLSFGTEQEQSESFEPFTPIMPDSEFVDGVCPECGALRTYIHYGADRWTEDNPKPAKIGHWGHCRRWLKSRKYVDCVDGAFVRRDNVGGSPKESK